jgi:hypothetical protein
MMLPNDGVAFDVDTALFEDDDNESESEQDGEIQSLPNDKEPDHSQSFGNSTYIRCEGFTPDELGDEGKQELVKMVSTELLLNYDVGVSNVQILEEGTTVIEIDADS